MRGIVARRVRGSRLDALRLERGAEQRADVLDRHHRGERQVAATAAGAARRHRRLLADLSPRRSGRRRHARRLLRHDDVRQDRRDRRGEREGAVAVHAAGLLRRGRARRRSRRRRRSPTRAGSGSTRRRPAARIYKLAVANGHSAWGVSITKLPSREKIAAALNFANGHVIATTGGYIGDAPPYQGHVAIISPAGALLHVWNSLCSNRRGSDRTRRAAVRATRRSGAAQAQSSTRRTDSCSSRRATRPGTGRPTGATRFSASRAMRRRSSATTRRRTPRS